MTSIHDGTDAERLRRRLGWPALARSVQPDVRVALLSTFTAEPLVPYLGTELAGAGIGPDLWVAPFNQIERQCLETDSDTARFAPHVAVCVPRLEELWSGRHLPLDADPDGYGDDLRFVAEACVAAATRWDTDLVFVLPPVPEIRPAGVGDDGNAGGVLAAAAAARESVRGMLADRARVHVVDGEAVLRSIGSRDAYRPALLATARIPYSEEYFDQLGRRIGRLIALTRRPGGTLLVLDAKDLAGTGGVAQTGRSAASADGGRALPAPDSTFTAYVAEVARAGLPIGVCAGSEPRSELEAVLPGARWQMSSADRAQDLRDLARAAGVDVNRVVFVSSDESDLARVRAELPDTATVELPAEREQWVWVLNANPAIDNLRPVRGTSVPVPVSTSVESAPTLEGFLASLRLSVGFVPRPELDATEAEDLTRRVSEFHLDGAVWKADRFTAADPRTVCFGVTVADRFGDHGMCGVVVAKPDGAVFVVEAWVLTCPVLGKGVEDRVLDRIRTLAAASQCTTIAFAYQATPRNDVLRAYLADLASGSASAPLASGPVRIPVGRGEAKRRVSAPQPPERRVSAPQPPERPVPPPSRRRPAVRPFAAAQLTSADQILKAIQSGRPPVAQAASSGQQTVTAPRTDMERRLLPIFRDVLRVTELGVDTGFFTLGDSMLGVQLVAKANRAGVRVTLRQLFQYQTVADLATVATVATVATEVAAEGPVVGVDSAPLLPLQSWFFGLGLAEPGHFNQSLRFELREDVDLDAVRRAVAALVERHASLRVRFEAVDGGVRQIDMGPPADPPFLRIDLSHLDPDAWEPALAERELALQRAMSPEDGRLAIFAVFTFGTARPPRLLVIFHHLAIDGITWRILLGDLQEGYRQALLGEVSLAAESFPVLAWARRLHEYAQSEPVRAELPRWLAAERTDIAALPADFVDDLSEGAFTAGEVEDFSAEETAALNETAVMGYRCSLDVLLLAAAVRVLTRWTGRSRLLVDVVNHGREAFTGGVDLSRTAGWLVMNVPTVFDASGADGLSDLVPAVLESMQAWSSDHGAGDSLLRHLCDDDAIRAELAALPRAEVLFSYDGDIDNVQTDGPLLGEVIPGTVRDIAPSASTPHTLVFEAMIIGGGIRTEIRYRDSRYRRATIQSLAKEWATEIRSLIGHLDVPGTPGRTPIDHGARRD